jgi:hypothetical protein
LAVREGDDFAEEYLCGLFGRQAFDGALGRNDNNHFGMSTRDKRCHGNKQCEYQAIAECYGRSHLVLRD